jgi:hypothetical protein
MPMEGVNFGQLEFVRKVDVNLVSNEPFVVVECDRIILLAD